MTYRLELLPGEPILVEVLDENFDAHADVETLLPAITAIFDSATEPLYLIIDLRGLKMNLDDMLFSTNMGFRQSKLFKHPKMKRSIMVTNSAIFSMMIRGVSSPIFGGINIEVVDSLEKALESARKAIGVR